VKSRFHEYARREYLDAVRYLRADDPKKAKNFIADVRNTVRRIEQRPESGSPGELGTRRKYLRKFHYTVIYRIQDGEIEILAVTHHRREEGYWYNRL